jgi:hypothetical protein
MFGATVPARFPLSRKIGGCESLPTAATGKRNARVSVRPQSLGMAVSGIAMRRIVPVVL